MARSKACRRPAFSAFSAFSALSVSTALAQQDDRGTVNVNSLTTATFQGSDSRGGASSLTSAGSAIQISAGSALAGNSVALAAFNRAADQWEQFLADPVQITISANLASLGPGILGQASSVQLSTGFNVIRNQMVSDNSTGPFASLTAALPTAATYGVTLPSTGGWTTEPTMYATAANLAAMGFDITGFLPDGSHASITFSSDFGFDFDRTDGIDPGLFDFEGVALHEIGHALGFISEMDYVDSVQGGSGRPAIARTTPWDLFRFSATGSNPSNLSQFGSMPRNLDPSQATVNDSISSFLGSNPEVPTSTGINTGSGYQASHWLNQAALGYYPGAMLPTLAPGQRIDIGLNDLIVLDTIGWDVNYAALPEPGTWAAMAFMGGLGLWHRTSRRRMQVAAGASLRNP
jgi:hypothetical protein